jgi:hypothetical protein
VDQGEDGKVVLSVIASASEAIHPAAERKNELLRRFAPLRKRYAFVAGNDETKERSPDERSAIRDPVLDCFPDFASLIRAAI